MDLAYSSADWDIFSSRRSSRGRRVWYRGNHVLHIAEVGILRPLSVHSDQPKADQTPANLMCEMSDVFRSKALEKSPLGGRPQEVGKRWYRGFRQCRPEGRHSICSTSRAHGWSGQKRWVIRSWAKVHQLQIERSCAASTRPCSSPAFAAPGRRRGSIRLMPNALMLAWSGTISSTLAPPSRTT